MIWLEEQKIGMKIAFVNHNLILSDGSSTVIWNLARRLARHHEVTIFAFFNSGHNDESGVQIQEIPIPFKGNRFVNPGLIPLFQNKWREMRKRLQEFPVIITYPYFASLIPLFPTKLKGPLHILIEWKVGGNPRLSIYERIPSYFNERMEAYSIRHADRVIAPSVCVERYVREKVGAGTTRMFLDGVDFSLFDKSLVSTKDIYDKYPFLRGSRLILFVGRLYPHKNIDALIRSLKSVQTEIPNSKLVVVGGFDRNLSYYRSLVKLAQELGLEESVVFAGVVSWQDLPKYYAACDVYASCSLYEGFLRAEAYAMEKPMVAFDVTANSETIRHGENGLLVKELNPEAFASALITLLGDDKLRVKMGRNGYQWAKENLDFDVIAENFARFIEDSVACRGK